MTTSELAPAGSSITLVELVDRLLDKGVVVSGEVTIAVADVDLIELGLRVLLSSVETMEKQR
jgi:gas vesicle structural protein